VKLLLRPVKPTNDTKLVFEAMPIRLVRLNPVGTLPRVNGTESVPFSDMFVAEMIANVGLRPVVTVIARVLVEEDCSIAGNDNDGCQAGNSKARNSIGCECERVGARDICCAGAVRVITTVPILVDKAPLTASGFPCPLVIVKGTVNATLAGVLVAATGRDNDRRISNGFHL